MKNGRDFADVAAEIEKQLAHLGMREWLVVFAAAIALLLYLVSRGYGWHDLARHYRSRNPYRGEWITQPAEDGEPTGELEVYFNNSVSQNAIKVGADSQGLHLATSAVFRLFHPPLFIPWNEVTAVGVREVPWIRENLVRFTFALAPEVPVDVDSEVARVIEKRSGGRWNMPVLKPAPRDSRTYR